MYFDLRDDDAVVVEIWGTQLSGRILYGANGMLDLITEITVVTGRMSPLPDWTQVGAVVGLEGGTQEVTEHVDHLLAHDVPIAGVWIQDWVGLRHAYDGDRLMWNWCLDTDYYPGWDGTTLTFYCLAIHYFIYTYYTYHDTYTNLIYTIYIHINVLYRYGKQMGGEGYPCPDLYQPFLL